MTDYIKSTPCKECGCRMWEPVYNWETEKVDSVKCGNCNNTRPFHRRSVANSNNPSQEKALARLEAYFKNNWLFGDKTELFKFEARRLDIGVISVVVETVEDYRFQHGGHFYIGKRGAIDVVSVYGMHDDKKKWGAHYAKMLGGYNKVK